MEPGQPKPSSSGELLPDCSMQSGRDLAMNSASNAEAVGARNNTRATLPDHAALKAGDLGSGLIDQSQKMTVAAMAMAEKKVWAHRS